MKASLYHFSQALLHADLSFRTLSDARVICDGQGLPRLMRTTHFVEAEICWQGAHWLLSLPLNASAHARVERIAAHLRCLNSFHVTPYRLLSQEMRWTDPTGEVCEEDLLLQLLPQGYPFEEALQRHSEEELTSALASLEAEFWRLGLSHNNLKESNLRWSEGYLIPLRYHDASFGEQSPQDAEAFARLRERIVEATTPSLPCVEDCAVAYLAQPLLTGHRWVSNTFEGLILVEDEEGFGYVDTENRPVIAPQFRWANDFHEGRAEVETATGMGLIDREGRYILPPEYEIVEYDPDKSLIKARKEGQWALFDYLGRPLTAFGIDIFNE